MAFVDCGKWKFKKFMEKFSSKQDTIIAKPDYIRYTVKHSIQNDVVRVTVYDNKQKSCAVKALGQNPYNYNPTVYVNNGINTTTGLPFVSLDKLYIDVDEPTPSEKTNGVTMEQKIADAYVQLEATAAQMNYENEKPYRVAEAVKKFEANKDTLKQRSHRGNQYVIFCVENKENAR